MESPKKMNWGYVACLVVLSLEATSGVTLGTDRGVTVGTGMEAWLGACGVRLVILCDCTVCVHSMVLYGGVRRQAADLRMRAEGPL